MLQQIRRDNLGRILGKVGNAFFHNEDESWKDQKVAPDKILFPNTGDIKIYPVTTYRLEDLK